LSISFIVIVKTRWLEFLAGNYNRFKFLIDVLVKKKYPEVVVLYIRKEIRFRRSDSPDEIVST